MFEVLFIIVYGIMVVLKSEAFIICVKKVIMSFILGDSLSIILTIRFLMKLL